VRVHAFFALLGLVACTQWVHGQQFYPVLVVQGLVLNSEGQPVSGSPVSVALSGPYVAASVIERCVPDSIEPPPGAFDYQFTTTGASGEFAFRFLQSWQPYADRFPPYRGELPSDSVLALISTKLGPTFAIAVRNGEPTLWIPDADKGKLIPLHARFPLDPTASLTRLPEARVLQIVIPSPSQPAA
jgi:hypothetical protein